MVFIAFGCMCTKKNFDMILLQIMNMLEVINIWIFLNKICAHHIVFSSSKDMEFETNFTL